MRIGRPRVTANPDVVARIVEDRAAGLSFTAIAAGLAADSVPPPGIAKRWWAMTVRAIIERAADPDSGPAERGRDG